MIDDAKVREIADKLCCEVGLDPNMPVTLEEPERVNTPWGFGYRVPPPNRQTRLGDYWIMSVESALKALREEIGTK